MFKPPGECPVCGEFVPAKSVACPDCGACERSGWNEDDAIYDGLDLPDDDFDYDKYLRQDRGKATAGSMFWWWVAAVLFVIFLLGLVAR
ncbi:MAG: hypothetical protein JNJ83_13770 [Verrucomicrobiaceae bacterium]|nr:hypothetical protein [Verrucomicrobiaceae bacterium]